jgi:hypothetical protein
MEEMSKPKRPPPISCQSDSLSSTFQDETDDVAEEDSQSSIEERNIRESIPMAANPQMR